MVIGPRRKEFQESSFLSQGGKRIDILVINPETLNGDTGLMLVLHGWGNNRYQYRDMMEDFSKRYNVACISPEFRDLGFDASPNGIGIKQPYDFSHLQVRKIPMAKVLIGIPTASNFSLKAKAFKDALTPHMWEMA